MSNNPHIRDINLLQPEVDLAKIDQAKGTRRKPQKKRPAHPAEGLLDADELSPDEPSTKKNPEPEENKHSQNIKDSQSNKSEFMQSDLPEIPPEPKKETSTSAQSSEKFSSNAIGEAPEIITGDFPEPIDI